MVSTSFCSDSESDADDLGDDDWLPEERSRRSARLRGRRESDEEFVVSGSGSGSDGDPGERGRSGRARTKKTAKGKHGRRARQE